MLWAVLSIFIGALLAQALQRVLGRPAGWLFAALPLGVLVSVMPFVPRLLAEGEVVHASLPWIPSLGVELAFSLDGLSLVFLALICGIGALIFIYASKYLQSDRRLGRFYAYLLLFTGSMAGLVLADDVFVLFVCWELTSVSSYLLIAWDHERPEARKAALTALLVTGVGGLAMLAGFVLLVLSTGETLISRFSGEAVRESPLYLPILILVLAGAFTKSAQFPFSFWLPRAMEAPTPVSAYLHSATMVKAGVYLLARLHPTLGGTREWFLVVTLVGAATMVVGAVLAVTQKDLKRILAQSTVSVLGLLTMLLGIGTRAAISAAVVYLIAHSLYKGALFMTAGTLDHETGTRDVTRLRGLARRMPVTATAAVLAAISSAGAPPLFGFLGKELFYEAVFASPSMRALLGVAAVLSSVLLVVVSVLVAYRPFFGGSPSAPRIPHEAPPSMWLGPSVLAAASLVFGLAPQWLGDLPGAAATAILGRPAPLELHLWHGFSPVLGASAATLLAGVVLFRVLSGREERLFDASTRLGAWGPARVYDAAFAGLMRFAAWQTRRLQTGHLRHYLLVTVLTTVVLVGAPLLRSLPLSISLRGVELPELVLAVVILGAAAMTTRTLSRLAVVAALGAIGVSVMLIYVIFSALDLALTQIMVEALTVVIFVLVLHHLPRFVNRSPARVWIPDAIVSVIFGATVALLILMSSTLYPDPTLSEYFVAKGYPEAHGRNIVNVILVDFRAMDTLGEATVLCVAGIGVYALLQVGRRRGA
ncbi:putative monovalent cation/H+ antiporter subunit A [Polyangium spumosum]|uniref:Putative monovalent cation/H+ antiporter subunit A n=1 Tax=Polyangium spumosum TaxID=889282 RepID=A0A6N7PJN8_9BACT|nr:putative monovalent cation/H+ antiporter subunit A [Polyangium spumosum]MRG92149.1 putative monovalent cation/H+ antiporter subunit A [Polyangium spumosum]